MTAAGRKWCENAVDGIGCFYAVVGAIVLGVMQIHDKGKFGKKVMLYAAAWMTWWASKWSFDYGSILLTKPAPEMAAGAAIIAAIITPVIGLTGWVLKSYLTESTESQRIAAGQAGAD